MSHGSGSKSKKRRHEGEEDEPETKRAKNKQKDASSPSSTVKSDSKRNKASEENRSYLVSAEHVLAKDMACALNCGHAKCPFGANSVAGASSDAAKHVELDFSAPLKCATELWNHNIAWHEDLEPKKGDGVALRIQRLFAMCRCARWSCIGWSSTKNTYKWAYALVTRLKDEIESFNSVMKKREGKSSVELKNLLSALSESVSGSLTKLSVSLSMTSSISPQQFNQDSELEGNQTRINALAALDNLYYLLYHYTLVSPIKPPSTASKDSSSQSSTLKTSDIDARSSKKTSKSLIPPPNEYFQLFYDPLAKEIDTMVQSFWKSDVDRITRHRMQKTFGNLKSALETSSSNPLLAIWYLRFVDYIRFYKMTGVSSNSKEMENAVKLAGSSSTTSLHSIKIKRVKDMLVSRVNSSEPICDEALQTFRDICRDWPSLIYAYAVPTPSAINTILKYGPIVEIGAGTGYWASMLEKAGAKVIALDSVPTSSSGPEENEKQQNEFHANVPAFIKVSRGDTSALRKFATFSLFACFPPPDDPMALDALRLFTGQHFIHIGEWEGFTGTSEFETHLFSNFELVERVELPNWQDTCYDLTVWKRKSATQSSSNNGTKAETEEKKRKEEKKQDESESNEVMAIPTSICFNCKREDRVLRRCRCCRIVSFCSTSCSSHASRQHASVHEIHGIGLKNLDEALDYNNTNHYRALRKKKILKGSPKTK